MIVFILLICNILNANQPDKIKETPDFCQADTKYGTLPKSGASHCAPVAVSNLLIYLNKNGFYKFTNSKNPTEENQFKLIKELGNYMKTDVISGTKPKNVVIGLEHFVRDKGYNIQVETMGWRSKKNRIGKIPNLKWIKKSSIDNSNVILNIGWYKYNKSSNTYFRTNGHYISVVGFDNNFLLVHDPAKRDGLSKKTLKCSLSGLKQNSVLELKSGKKTSSKGYYKLNCLQIKKGNDLAIIDGAIAFSVQK